MSLARNKRVGAETENRLADWLRARGLDVTQPRLNGRDDLGDIHVRVGSSLHMIEVKSTSTPGGWDALRWLREMRRERDAVQGLWPDKLIVPWVVVRPKGTPDPGEWVWLTSTEEVWT